MSKTTRLASAIGFVVVPVALALATAAIGAFPIPLSQVLAALVGKADPQMATVLYTVRLPRIGAAILVVPYTRPSFTIRCLRPTRSG
mgnify:CR=1 FL=1